MALPTPTQQYVNVWALAYGGAYVPWNGVVTQRILTATNVRVNLRANDVGTFSFDDILLAPNPSVSPLGGVVATVAGFGGSDPLLPRGTLVLFELVESAADLAAAGDANGTVRLVVGVVEQRKINWTGDEAPTISYSGRTWSALLEDVMVYPYGGLSRRPFADSRVFSWASPGFDDSAWGAAKQLTTQGTGSTAWTLDSGQLAPDGWPFEPNAYWIWADNPGGAGHTPSTPSTSTTSNADLGLCLFRKSWTPSTATTYAIFITADNYYTAYLDGVEFAANRDNGYGWQTTTRYDVTVDTSVHVIGVLAENIGGLGSNPGGVLVSVRKVAADGVLSAEIVSNNTWKVYAYPSSTGIPGWTAGQIVGTLITEALARDTSNRSPLRAHRASYTFSNSTGSDGVAFTALPDIAVPVGSSLLDMLRTLRTQGGVAWLDSPRPVLTGAGTLQNAVILNLYDDWPAQVNKGSFALGSNLLDLQYDLGG